MVNCACIFSAFCFVVSNALGIAVIVEDLLKVTFNVEKEKVLDADYLQERWMHRMDIAPLIQTAHLFNAAAWLFFLTPILQLAWALSRGGKRKIGVHSAIAAFAMAGCMSEILSRLLMFGGWNAAHWIAKSFTLTGWLDSGSDFTGWKALELAYVIMNGMLMWIDAFEWVCLFVIMILLYFSVGTQMPEQRALSLWWGRLGLLIAFLSFIDLTAELLRMEDYKDFQKFSIFIALVNTCILLPLWLLWLSCTIRNVMPTTNDDDINPDPIWSPGVQSEGP